MPHATPETVPDLAGEGVLAWAVEPSDNGEDLALAECYSVPLIAEDYPAKTAAMWNAAYRALGMGCRNRIAVARPAEAEVILQTFRRDAKYRGGGAGVGFKERMAALLDDVTPSLARAMAAVNIVKKLPNGRLIGTNTDGLGYALALEAMFIARDESLGGKRALILGARGSASAIAFALAERGVELTILNRTEELAHELVARLNAHFEREVAVAGGRNRIADAMPRQDVVVATVTAPAEYSTLGNGLDQPVSEESARENLAASAAVLSRAKPSLVVSDIRLRQMETAMLAQARELGFETLDGIPMVINQGVEAFWWLHGEDIQCRGRTKDDIAAMMRRAARGT